MRKFFLTALIVGLATTRGFCGDDLKMPINLDRLASRATESVDVTLDGAMLQLASKFLSSDDPDDAKIKQIVSKLKSVYVRSFEFSKDAQYSMDDIEALRAQLKSPQWSRIVSDKSKTETSGLVVIDAEPKELTIVHIDGPIDVSELSELGGHMGIPRLRHAIRKNSEKDH
jgi:hypothetical protein